MKIGIMSDTHNSRLSVEWAIERAGDVDLWLHAGDCVPDAAYLALLTSTPVENVLGNNDWPDGKTQDDLVVDVAGHRIFLTHGHIYRVHYSIESLVYAAEHSGADIAVYGHTHKVLQTYVDGERGKVLVLNPGSLTLPRDDSPPAFMLLHLEEGATPSVEVIYNEEQGIHTAPRFSFKSLFR